MRENLKQVKSFITFDLPVDTIHISTLFTSTHRQNLLNFPYWSLNATRKKVISRYWFGYVCMHFTVLWGFAALIALPFTGELNRYYLPGLLIAGCLSFLVLFVTHYWPRFYADLLPKLDSLVDEYENRQKNQMQRKWLEELQCQLAHEYKEIAGQREELAKECQQLEIRQVERVKCRKEQFPTLTLALILYVLDKTSGINNLQCNDRSATLLTKLFGKDQGGIKDSLQLIFGKKQDLSDRHRTEILNRFSEAYDFFEKIQFPEGAKLLQLLELKFKA